MKTATVAIGSLAARISESDWQTLYSGIQQLILNRAIIILSNRAGGPSDEWQYAIWEAVLSDAQAVNLQNDLSTYAGTVQLHTKAYIGWTPIDTTQYTINPIP